MKKLLKNVSWIILGNILQLAVSFFVGLLSVRYLGPSNYGSLTYINSYITFFSAICLMGLDTVVVNRLVHYQNKDGEVIASAILMRLITSSICYATLILTIFMVDGGEKSLVLIASISGLEMILRSFTTITFYYQYKLLSKKTVIAETISFVIASIFRIWLLATQKSVYWFAGYIALQYTINALFYIVMFKHDCDFKIAPRKELCVEMFKICIPYLISNVLITVYTQTDRIMIKQIMSSTEQVGYYSVAYALCNLIAFIPTSISLSARPVLMQLKKDNNPKYNTYVTQTIASVLWFTIVFSVCITLFADFIIKILYGSAYASAAPVLKILVWCTLMENLIRIRDVWLIGENQSKYVTVFSASGTILNIVLNYFLIKNHGITGAAIATVITQFIIVLLLPMLFKGTRQFSINIIHAMMLKDIDLKEMIHTLTRKGKKND